MPDSSDASADASPFSKEVERALGSFGLLSTIDDGRPLPTPAARRTILCEGHLLSEIFKLVVEFRDLLLVLHELFVQWVDLLPDRLDLLRELADLGNLLLNRPQIGNGRRFWQCIQPLLKLLVMIGEALAFLG